MWRKRTSGAARRAARSMRRWSAAGVVALGGLTWLSQGGCVLDDVQFASNNPVIECFVTVRNHEAQAELGGLEVPEQSLASRTEPFLGDGVPLKSYSLNDDVEGDCADGWGFDSVEEAEADWRRFARQRIDEVEADAESGSIFNRFPGDWCEVEGTLECQVTDEPVGICIENVLTGGDPLPVCPEPPPPPVCFEIACDGAGAACETVAFGDVGVVARLQGQAPVGDGARTAVTITNCGGDEAPRLIVRGLDGTVAPVGALFDFSVPPDENACHPVNGDDEAVELVPGANCALEVLFEPQQPGEHRASFAFSSNAQVELHEIALTGNGLPGALAFAVTGSAQLPAELCFAGLDAGNCTAARTLEIANAGPGVVVVESLDLVAVAAPVTTFELVDPPTAPFALAAGATQTVDVRWCRAADARDRATLDLRSNDPNQPSFLLDLEHRAAADPPCPAGS